MAGWGVLTLSITDIRESTIDSSLKSDSGGIELSGESGTGFLIKEQLNGNEFTLKRTKRQVVNIGKYDGPVISDLHTSQRCDGIYLRWKRPRHPVGSTDDFTSSEFQYYNVYRSSKYFTDVTGMTPYASGKTVYELRNMKSVFYLDRDPITNDAVWYAVTIVTRDGREQKETTPAKGMYIGAFGSLGSRMALTPNAVKGNTLHQTAVYNPDRNEYFIAYDVDVNYDGKPDRLYGLRLNPNGMLLGGNILDFTVNVPGGVIMQGKPSAAYNPKANEYIVAFQVTATKLFGGKTCIVAQRIRTARTDKVANPQLLLKATDNSRGRQVFIPVQNPKIVYNPITSGYVTSVEIIGLNGRHGVALHFSDARATGISSRMIFGYNVDARSRGVYFDSQRNELYIVVQIPNTAVNKQGEVTAKQAYTFAVTKRNATGAAFKANPINLLGGETDLYDASLTGFYDRNRDRLMLFWNDKLPNGRTYIESSRVLLSGNNLRSVEYSSKSDKLFCDTQTNVRRPSAAPFPANGGQIVTWEEKISGKWKIGGSFIRDEVFQFTVQDQMKPLQLTNGKTGKVLLIWQERVNAKQNNLFARHIQPVSHRCAVKCQANEICLRDDHCVKRYKDSNPCTRRNGGCPQICYKSSTGAKCGCRDGYKLVAANQCAARGKRKPSYTALVGTLNEIWQMTSMSDKSQKFVRLPYTGKSVVAIDFDEVNKKIYWSSVDDKMIMRGKLDGSEKEIFLRSIHCDGMKVDAKTKKLYFTDFQSKRIEVISLDKTSRRTLISSGLDKPRAIVLAKVSGISYLYWTDWGTKPKIERAQFNSHSNAVSNRRAIVSSSLGWPNGLCIDERDQLLYWGDALMDKIELSDLLGNNRRILAGATVQHPFSLLIHQNSLFWTDWQGTLFRADKKTGLNQQVIIQTLNRPSGFYIMEGKARSDKKCSDPGTPPNGDRVGDDFTSGSLITFKCNNGFNIVGEAQIVCQANGQWTERRPFCVETRCPNPPRPANGNRVIVGRSPGDGVVYTCNPGYKMVGTNVRRCKRGGKWSGKSPRCVALPVFVQVPRNETVSFGKSAVIQCKAAADTEVTISWLKDGQPFTVKQTETRIFIFKTSVFIADVRYSDSGRFTCKATNEAGSVQSSAYLRVLGKRIPQCGIPKFGTRQRIIGGRPAGAGSHPWMAMLWNKQKGKLFCGGSLIAPRWVLTAAHCLERMSINAINVKFGKIHALKKEAHEQVREVIKIYMHNKFDSTTFDSDIALLKLASPVTITDYVIPVCLPYADSDFKLLVPGAITTVIGWGSKSVRQLERERNAKKLQELEIPIIDKDECKRKMTHPVTANMICAGEGDKGDACRGDSGGPLTIKNKKTGKHILIGIVSWGEDCAVLNTYGVYVKVQNFLSWINSYMDD